MKSAAVPRGRGEGDDEAPDDGNTEEEENSTLSITTDWLEDVGLDESGSDDIVKWFAAE